MENETILKRFWLWFLDFVETIVIALAIFVVMYRFLFQPHQVQGNSMFDNFYNGEYLLTDKLSYRFKAPERGDIIVFKAPKNEDYDYIKRVIGLPGERIKILNGKVYINDQPIDESPYLDKAIITQSGYFSREGLTINIAADNYFVMGDNRMNSSDSRDWGTVPRQNIIGKAWLRYWPLNKIGLVDKYPYD